ncbi:hypothetical protein FN846DRAFT_931928, partial [Sphaerosporella brunnea]
MALSRSKIAFFFLAFFSRYAHHSHEIIVKWPVGSRARLGPPTVFFFRPAAFITHMHHHHIIIIGAQGDFLYLPANTKPATRKSWLQEKKKKKKKSQW